MSDLVKRLAEGQHRVEIALRPKKSAQAFKECLDRDYVHVRFTETRGGTELGVTLDRDRTRLDNADFQAGSGSVRVVGTLSLDFVPVVCVADIDVATLSGTGHLEIVAAQEPVASITP